MRRFILTLFLLLMLLFVILNITVYPGLRVGERDYSDWMKRTLQGSERLIDIRMLGAHDALSSDIRYASALDEASAASIQKGILGKLIKGFSVRQSRTQRSDLKALLEHGVRYLDVRLSQEPGSNAWYSTHNYFSRPLINDLRQLADFLRQHPGEVVLFDIQHIYGINYADSNFITALDSLFTEVGLSEFVVRNDERALSELTYDQVTQQKTTAAILVLCKAEQEHSLFWPYKNSIRSAWPNSDEPEEVFRFLSQEQKLIESGRALTGNQIQGFAGSDSRQAFRVMQGVITMQLDGKGIFNALIGWSLMHRAESFNPALISQPEFGRWLSWMPIVMMDFSDSAEGAFHESVMEMLLEANSWR